MRCSAGNISVARAASEIFGDRPDPTYYRDRGWFDSDYFYPTKLGPLMRAAGLVFDRIAARSSKAREYHRA